jgi:drug/metabolite transporter (DMT)-like permease
MPSSGLGFNLTRRCEQLHDPIGSRQNPRLGFPNPKHAHSPQATKTLKILESPRTRKLHRLAASAFNNAYLLLVFMAFFWAGNQIVGRAAAGHIPPVALSFLRWSLATALVLPFAWTHLQRNWPIVRDNWHFLAFLGVIGGGAFNTLQYIGLNYTTALNALVLNSTGPILIALSCFVIFGDRLAFNQVAGTLVSTIGVLVVISQGSLAVLLSLTLNKGDLLLLLAMSTTGVYAAYLRQRPKIHWLSFLFSLFFASALFNAPLVLIEIYLGFRFELSPFTVLAVGYVAIFPSILAYMCFTRGVELIGAVRAGIFLHLIPLFGALLAIGLLGEPLRAYHVIGILLILAGVALTNRKQ